MMNAVGHSEGEDARGGRLTIRLKLPEEHRRAMVVALYGAPNDNVPARVNMPRALAGLARRAFGRE